MAPNRYEIFLNMNNEINFKIVDTAFEFFSHIKIIFIIKFI